VVAAGSEGEEKGRVRRATPRVEMEKQRRTKTRTRLRLVLGLVLGCETKVKKCVRVRMIVNDILCAIYFILFYFGFLFLSDTQSCSSF